jgi:transketolase
MPSFDAMTPLEKTANTIRCLSIDAIQKANSGHPGMPMGCAEFAAVLWSKFLRHNPRNPAWPNRDRFVLSPGHGSMLLYSVLHLSGYDLSLDDLKEFRQWGSRTPGHPEYGCTPGVETTTGPLGQGFANGVGMALAEAVLADRFKSPGAPLVDHYTYGIVGDGDLMEGISSEAASFAGHLGLGKLIFFFDSNRITIEGSTEITSSDDTAGRFKSCGWHVQEVDGHDFDALEAAMKSAQSEKSKPSLIIGHTHIAKGSPNKQDSESSHGSPLGDEEILLTKESFGWPKEPFFVPQEARELLGERAAAGAALEKEWNERFAEAREKDPEAARRWETWHKGEMPVDAFAGLPDFAGIDAIATRAASGKTIQALAPVLENMIGGSADLAPSNKTMIDGAAMIGPGAFGGRNIHFGVREHAMGAIMNGMSLHGGLIPYGGTFLVFADYMRPAIRMAALTGIQVIYVFTHDSIFVGEDGPTHQPVEHVASLRTIPNLTVIRPADAHEAAGAWAVALKRRKGPTALVLSRQKLPVFDGTTTVPDVEKGAWIASREAGTVPDVILIASGSEVHVALGAKEKLGKAGAGVRVVSMPSWELFEGQSAGYREEILPSACKRRLAVEAGLSMGWEKYTGSEGVVLGIERFGASAPYSVLAEKFGMDSGSVAAKTRELLGG